MDERECSIRIKAGDHEIEVSGPRKFVEEIYETIWEMARDLGTMTDKQETVKEIAAGAGILDNIALVEFYRQKNPKNHQQRMLLFFYWLKHKEGKSEATTKEIMKCYQEVGVPKDSNSTKTAKRLASAKKGYLMPGSKPKTYKLTITGEALVETGFQETKE